jgi:hypothetical protein
LILLFALTPGVKADTVTLQEGLSVITSQGYEMRIAMARETAAARGQDKAQARLRPQVNVYADHTWLQNQPEAIFGAGTGTSSSLILAVLAHPLKRRVREPEARLRKQVERETLSLSIL